MAEIVLAVGASHAPGLVGLFDDAPEASRAMVTEAYGRIARDVAQAELDVLLVFANDHLANSRPRSFPDFLLGLADEHSGPFEWFKPWIGCRDYVLPGSRDVAEQLFHGLSRRGVRLSASHENLKYDDNLSIPAILCDLDREGGPAIVPFLQNCTVPPIPDQHKAYEFGQRLREVIEEDLPEGMRVGLFGSGGLSHEPGGANYYYIDEEFDRYFLDLLVENDHERILRELTLEKLNSAGGGGTTELLAWLVVLGAIGDAPCESLGYTAYSNWKCGVGAVRWDVAATTAAKA
jgi:aromatic ring-opening dioxygenase catalytic subunit (LigB family)